MTYTLSTFRLNTFASWGTNTKLNTNREGSLASLYYFLEARIRNKFPICHVTLGSFQQACLSSPIFCSRPYSKGLLCTWSLEISEKLNSDFIQFSISCIHDVSKTTEVLKSLRALEVSFSNCRKVMICLQR